MKSSATGLRRMSRRMKAITDEMKDAMYKYMPLRNFACFGGGMVTFEELQEIIDKLNKA